MFLDVNSISDTPIARLGPSVHQHRGQDAELQEDFAFQRDGHTDRRRTRYGAGIAICTSISAFSQERRQQASDITAEAQAIQESYDARIQDSRRRNC